MPHYTGAERAFFVFVEFLTNRAPCPYEMGLLQESCYVTSRPFVGTASVPTYRATSVYFGRGAAITRTPYDSAAIVTGFTRSEYPISTSASSFQRIDAFVPESSKETTVARRSGVGTERRRISSTGALRVHLFPYATSTCSSTHCPEGDVTELTKCSSGSSRQQPAITRTLATPTNS